MTSFTLNMYPVKTRERVCDQSLYWSDHRLISAMIGAHSAMRSLGSRAIPAIRSPELIVTVELFWSKMIGMCLFNASGSTQPALKPVIDSTSLNETQVMRRQFRIERTFFGSTERSPAVHASAYWLPMSLSRIHFTIWDGSMPRSCAVSSMLVVGLLCNLSLIHISEPTRQAEISYAVFCLKKKK